MQEEEWKQNIQLKKVGKELRGMMSWIDTAKVD